MFLRESLPCFLHCFYLKMLLAGAFLLICDVLFCLIREIGKLVSLFLWLRKLLYFVVCFHVWRAWCFICFLPWFLSLNTQLPSCLIFCNTFVYCLPDFLCRNPRFSLFRLLQVFLDVNSWVCAIFLHRFCLLLWSGLFSCILLVTTTWFVVFVKFLSILLPLLVFAFFDIKIGVLHEFIFARFVFLMYFLRLLPLALLIRSYKSPLQSLTVQNHAHYPLCSAFWPAQS